MRRLRTTALFSLLIPALTFAQAGSLESKLDKVFEPWNHSNTPGGVVGIVKDGKLVYTKAFGMASLELNAPLTVDSTMDIGSVSKQFTAMSILLLEEEGKLSLDDEIQKYVPEVPKYSKPITIRHLLSHTSGLRDYLTLFALTGWDLNGYISNEQALDMMSRQKGFNFLPGTSWNYCNSGFMICAQIVKRVSGQSLGAYAKSHIFTPLGMTNTRFDDDNTAVVPRRAKSYRLDPFGVWRLVDSRQEIAGDGGVLTTLSDFAKWDANFSKNTLGKGDQNLIKKMETATKLVNGASSGYGLGLFIDSYKGLPRIQHGGDWLGFNALYTRYKDQKVSIFTFSNDGTQNGKSLNDQVADIMMADVIKKDAPKTDAPKTGEVELTAEMKKKLAGRWKLAVMGTTQFLTISEKNGKFSMQVDGQPPFQLYARDAKTFFIKEVEFSATFEKEKDGKFEAGTFAQVSGSQTIKGTLERAADFAATEEMIDAIAGTYYCSDLGVNYTLSRKGKQLMMAIGKGEAGPITLVSEKKVSAGPMSAEFVVDAGGKYTGFTLNAGRANNLVFTRIK